MGSKTKQRPLPPPKPTGEDATPERLAKEPEAVVVETMPDDDSRALRKARRFRKPHLDRWHDAGMLTYRQFKAGEHYRDMHERALTRVSIVAAYGPRTGAGEHPGVFGYGLPRVQAVADARSEMRWMRDKIPQANRGTLDRYLLRDEMPRPSGRGHASLVAAIRQGLDALADYLSWSR